ncbi:hypothetical protein JB92DRAFT_3116383 [Gautieria morchelliformis]|nr:hypothetical protein JB92DRAFT_3116383 [Gautieria morchelliformis]
MPQPGMTRHHLNRSAAAKLAHLGLTLCLFDPGAPLNSQTSDSQCVLDYGPVPPRSPVKTIMRNSPQLEVKLEPSTPKLPQSPVSFVTPTPRRPLKCKRESVDEDSHWLYNGTLSSPSLASVASDVEPSATLRIRQLEEQVAALECNERWLLKLLQDLQLTLAKVPGDANIAVHELRVQMLQDSTKEWLQGLIKMLWEEELAAAGDNVAWAGSSGAPVMDDHIKRYFMQRVYHIAMQSPKAA